MRIVACQQTEPHKLRQRRCSLHLRMIARIVLALSVHQAQHSLVPSNKARGRRRRAGHMIIERSLSQALGITISSEVQSCAWTRSGRGVSATKNFPRTHTRVIADLFCRSPSSLPPLSSLHNGQSWRQRLPEGGENGHCIGLFCVDILAELPLTTGLDPALRRSTTDCP